MAYITQKQLVIAQKVSPKPRASAHKRAKRLNWFITTLISFAGTLMMSWGITLGEVVRFLVRDSGDLRYLGFLVGLGLSIGMAMAISAFIQLLSAIWLWLYKRYHNHSKSRATRLPHSTTQHQTTIDDFLDEVNFQIWSIIGNTTRGLSLSLAFVFIILILSNS